MEMCELKESYSESIKLKEEFNDAIGIGDYDKALRLNEDAYRLAIDRYLKGNNVLKTRVLSELEELSAQFNYVNDVLALENLE